LKAKAKVKLIRPGNTKLGEVACFSILAGNTCPGKTETCAENCYAMKQFFKMENVRKAHRRNWAASEEPDFEDRMIDEIRQEDIELLRVHVAGDFYNAGYIRKWIRIAESCPESEFFAYTHSWHIEELQDPLKRLAELPNLQLWWSCDKDTHVEHGEPHRLDGVKVAYLQSEPGEPIPEYTDLVFRVKRKTVEKYVDGRLVCPAEQGIKPKPSCEKCRLCFSGKDIPKKLHSPSIPLFSP